ncbi:MAG: hypothetical protein ACI9QQ_001523 [Myxococcota bacterium]|jgi:hypothetical protein
MKLVKFVFRETGSRVNRVSTVISVASEPTGTASSAVFALVEALRIEATRPLAQTVYILKGYSFGSLTQPHLSSYHPAR